MKRNVTWERDYISSGRSQQVQFNQCEKAVRKHSIIPCKGQCSPKVKWLITGENSLPIEWKGISLTGKTTLLSNPGPGCRTRLWNCLSPVYSTEPRPQIQWHGIGGAEMMNLKKVKWDKWNIKCGYKFFIYIRGWHSIAKI